MRKWPKLSSVFQHRQKGSHLRPLASPLRSRLHSTFANTLSPIWSSVNVPPNLRHGQEGQEGQDQDQDCILQQQGRPSEEAEEEPPEAGEEAASHLPPLPPWRDREWRPSYPEGIPGLEEARQAQAQV